MERGSIFWRSKIYKAVSKIAVDYPTHRYLFVALTVKNCPITQLRETLIWTKKSWQRFSQLKAFPAIGWICSTEVTKGIDGSAHPRLYCLLLVRSGYFSRSYITKSEWVEMWRQSLRVDYNPVVEVKKITNNQHIPELLEPRLHCLTLTEDSEWLDEYVRQVRYLESIRGGGILNDYLNGLEKSEGATQV